MIRPLTCLKLKEVAQGHVGKDPLTQQAEGESSVLASGGTTRRRHQKSRRDLQVHEWTMRGGQQGESGRASVQPDI